MSKKEHPVKYRQLIKSFDGKQAVDKGDYKYFYTQLTDHKPACTPQILQQAVTMLKDLAGEEIYESDVIVGEEDKGGFLAALLSNKTLTPFTTSTWYSSDIDEEVGIKFSNGYKDGTLYLNGVEEGDQVYIIDDLVSTGGTLISLIKAVRSIGAEVKGCAVLFEKPSYGGVEAVKDETGVEVQCGFSVKIEEMKSKVDEVYIG